MSTSAYRGPLRYILGINIQKLVELATQYDTILRIPHAVGDALLDGDDLLVIDGSATKIQETELMSQIATGWNQSLKNDPAFAVRY